MAIVFGINSSGEWEETARLNAGGGTPEGAMGGSAVLLAPGEAVVGQPGPASPEDPADYQRGRVQIYDPTTGAETQTIIPPDETARRFGASIALKGDYLLIGAPGTPDTVGAVFVYTSRANGRWVYRETIEGTAAGIGSGFGESVAVHLDQGIIGAPRDDRKTSDGGAVYFHDLPAPEVAVNITVSDRLYTYDGTSQISHDHHLTS